MHYNEKDIFLKDGTPCILRSPEEYDAEDLLGYLHTVTGETHYLLSYPEEVTLTFEQQIAVINKINKSNNEFMINAYINGELAGNTHISCISGKIKSRHRASLGITVKKKFWGNGLGTILFKESLDFVKEIGYEQIELSVYSDNQKAQSLYERYGFHVWGCIKNAFKLKDGTYCDDIIMGKMLKV